MAGISNRAPLAIPKTLGDNFERGFMNYGSDCNKYIDISQVTSSVEATSNRYDESIYEDPDVLTQRIHSDGYRVRNVFLVRKNFLYKISNFNY